MTNGCSEGSNSNDNDEYTGSVVAPDFEVYSVFIEIFDPLIRNLHNVTASGELPDQPWPPHFFCEDDVDPKHLIENYLHSTIKALETNDIDPSNKFVMAGIIECTRNFADQQLPLTMRISQLEDTERIITNILMCHDIKSILTENSSEEAGTYYTLSEIMDPFSEIRTQLAASGLLLPITESENINKRQLHGKFWPYGRGVYYASSGDLAVWVNVQDHLRVICCSDQSKPGLIGKAYVRLARIIEVFDRLFKSKWDRKLGFLTSRPWAIGNTLRFDLIVKFPSMSNKLDELKRLCLVRGLRIHRTLKRDTLRLGNQQSLSIGEFRTYQDFYRAIANILNLEKEHSLNNSLKIANVIANIFKRRRLSGSKSLKT